MAGDEASALPESYARALDFLVGIAACLSCGSVLWEVAHEAHRIHPFSALGWHNEMLTLALSIGVLGLQVLLTYNLISSRNFPTHIAIALLLGLV